MMTNGSVREEVTEIMKSAGNLRISEDTLLKWEIPRRGKLPI
jgi:hypothetical protein